MNMDSTHIQDDQAASTRRPVPHLGPAFVTDHDAAHWAHQQIGNRRETVFGGLVFKRDDGMYLPSVPVAGTATAFDFQSDLLKVDANRNFLAYEGHSVHALYSSRGEDGTRRSAQIQHWTGAQRRLDRSFFPINILRIIIQVRMLCTRYYLSGFYGSLIQYESSGSATEASFLNQLMAAKPAADFDDYIAFINETARAGYLRVIVANAELGGKPGQLLAPWTLNQTLSQIGQDALAPLASQVSRRWHDAVRSVLPPLGFARQESLFGYLYKSASNQYVAEFPSDELKAAFALTSGKLSLPKVHKADSEFLTFGIYCSLSPQAKPTVAKESWLAENFFTASALAAVVMMAGTDDLGLHFYLRANDGALLMYHCTGSQAQSQLFANRGADLDGRLKDATLSPSEFVRQVAAVGTLTVVEPGRVWDKAGVVGPQWRAFAKVHASLSPAFVTADDVARYLHYKVGSPHGSFLQAYIFKRSDGLFVASRLSDPDRWLSLWGGALPTDNALTRVELEGHQMVGEFNRPVYDLAEVRANYPQKTSRQLAFLISTPSTQAIDMTLVFSDQIKVLYTSGTNGTLIKYAVSGSRAEREFGEYLAQVERDGQGVARVQGFDGTREGLIKELVKLGELTVLLADETWYNVQGRVPATWEPETPFAAAAPIDTPLSWVFTDLATAARYAHDRMQATADGRRVGCILKHSSAEQYVVSEPCAPIPAGETLFVLANVFGNASLPPGFALRGWYCRSAPDATGIGAEPWLYEGFIDTTDFAQGIAALRIHPESNLAFYLSTADGAQLAYDASGSAEESQLYQVLPDGRVTDNGLGDELRAATVTPHEMIQKVAAAGALSVLQPGTLWDVAGLVADTWRPYALAPRPQLSRGFLQIEDAARYAHGQIGSWREGEYCGYILQRPDGLYVATEPLPASDAGRFALGVVYPQDVKGRSLLPPGHMLKAVYGSSRGVSLLEPERLQRPGWSRDDACLEAQMFSALDVHTLIRNRQQVSVAYLSGAEDCLLAYDLIDSAAQANLFKALDPLPHRSPTALNLASGTLTAREWISQVAAAGSVRVVQANPLWGAPGLIAEHWRPRLPIPRRERPEQIAYGPVCASAADAARALHTRLDHEAPTQTGFGFMLKHRDQDAFVCSELVPAWDRAGLFALSAVFAVDDEGEFIYPAGYQLHALVYRRNWMPQGLTTAEHWLAQHFISAGDLASATVEAKRQRETGALTGLPVFISTLDQALLQVQTPVASTLFNPVRQPSGVYEDVQTLMASGQLSAVGFVNEVAKLSWLSVLVPSECWALAGKLDVSQAPWTAFANFMRRPLSPLFSNQADAVRYVHQQLGTQRDTLQGGLVLQRNGKFVATLAVPVLSEDFDPNVILPGLDVSQALLAPGWKMVARYRSRVARVLEFWLPSEENAVYQNLFSTKVLETALKSGHLWTHEYLLTPDGSLIGFSTQDAERSLLDSARRNEATQLLSHLETSLAPNSLALHDPYSNAVEQQMRSGRKTPTELVNQLARVGTLQVLEGGPLWGTAQRVLPGWMPGLAYVAPQAAVHAVADRQLGPVFKHADDAARHGHQYAQGRADLSFGVILKSSDNGHFVACAPVKGDDLGFALDRAFLRGQLPSGYSLQGLYLRLPQRAAPELPQAEGYAQLMAPAVVLAALSFLRVAQSERFLALHVSCADGSLFRYQAVRIDPDWDSSRRQAAYLKHLNSRGSIDSHVLKLVESGELRVLDSSPFWDALLPRIKRLATTLAVRDTRMALGPLCAHPDDAARQVWQQVVPLEHQARLGAVLGNGDSDTFIAVQPVADPGPSVAVGLRPDTPAYKALFEGIMNLGYPSTSTRYPAGYKVMGVQQLFKLDTERQHLADRYEEGLAHNFIAQKEIRGFIEMLRQDKIAGARYYFTPVHGALIVYEPSYHADESQLLRDDWIDEDTGVVKVKPSEVIRRLATSGKLTILETDRFWQPRSQVARRLLHAFKQADQGV